MALVTQVTTEQGNDNKPRNWNYVETIPGIYEPIKGDRVSNLAPRFVNVGHGVVLFVHNGVVAARVDDSWKQSDVRFAESSDKITINLSNS